MMFPVNLKSHKRKVLLYFLVFTLFLAVNASLAAISVEDPRETVNQLVEKIKSIKRPSDDSTPLSSSDIKQNQKIFSEINNMIDITEIGRYALSSSWNRVGESGRRRFIELFKELLEKVAYPNTAKFFKDLELEIRKVKVLGNKAMVYSSVYHEEEGRVDIDFKLKKEKNKWVIIDVYLDGVSLVRNLRTQCQKIIKENSFAELLRRMEKKAKEEGADFSEITARN